MMEFEQRIKLQLGELIFTCNQLTVELEKVKTELEQERKKNEVHTS